MKNKMAIIFNIITVPPMVGLFALTWLYLGTRQITLSWYLLSIFLLVLLPISSYWLKHLIPPIREKGRDGERKLAFIMAVISYIIGTPIAYFVDAPRLILFVFLSYLVSGILLAFVNKVIKYKASGHACGVTGPLALLVFVLGFRVLWACLLVPMVFWGRLYSKRHTWGELIGGSLVGIVGTSLCMAFL